MRKLIVHAERCKACQYCIHFCPKGAINLAGRFNKLGYKTIVIDPEKCIGCGICNTICPDSVMEIYNDAKEEV